MKELFMEGEKTATPSLIPLSDSLLKKISSAPSVHETLVRALAENAEDGIFCKDAACRFTFVNQAMGTLLNRPAEEVLDRTAAEVLDANAAEMTAGSDAEVLEGGSVESVWELPIEGRTRHFRAIQTPILGPEGDVVGILGVVRDVTECMQIRRDLAAGREMFAKAFDNSVDLVAICSEDDFSLIEVNETFLKVVESPRADVIGKPLTSIDIGIDETVKESINLAIRANGSVRDVEVTMRGQRGERFYGLLCAALITHSRGRMILLMMKDISQRKQAEQLLRIQRDLSIAAGEAAGPDEIIECLLDYSLRIEGLDSGSVYTIDERTGETELVLSAGFSDDFLQTVTLRTMLVSPILEPLASGAPLYMTFAETKLATDDFRDGLGLKAMAVVPIRHDNRVVGVLHLASHTREEIPKSAKHTIEAVSGMIGGAFARARAEKALRESEEKLRQSEKMQAIGQLAGGMAHDFNNQLMGITGYADLLRVQVADNPKASQFLEHILLATRRSADLTAQLLAFARKGKYLSVSVDLHKTIQEVINLLSHSFDKKIAIRCHLRAKPCVTTGDPTQLQNAVLNLALNARDAMPDGGELIFTTDMVRFDGPRSWDSPPFDLPPGDYLSIGVSDTGVGMTDEIRRRAFEPFYTTKEQGKGTGMGLAAVFGTIKNHRGAVTVDSALHKGTSFRVLLPLHAPSKPPTEIAITSGTPSFEGLRVLLVDDEEIVLTVGREMLSHLGCNTRVCRNGREAVKIVQQHPEEFDLIVLDMVMPEMNGRDALVVIKKNNPKQRVILSSGYSMGERILEFSSDPAVGFIQKPFHLDELSAKMEEILVRRPG